VTRHQTEGCMTACKIKWRGCLYIDSNILKKPSTTTALHTSGL